MATSSVPHCEQYDGEIKVGHESSIPVMGQENDGRHAVSTGRQYRSIHLNISLPCSLPPVHP